MEREKNWERIAEIDTTYRERLMALVASHDVLVTISGLPALTTCTIPDKQWPAFKTWITQEMLKAGFLAPPSFYASLAHTEALLDKTFGALDPVFATIAACRADKRKIEDLLEGSICQTGFNRLN